MPTVKLKLLPEQSNAITEIIQTHRGVSSDGLIDLISRRLLCSTQTAAKKLGLYRKTVRHKPEPKEPLAEADELPTETEITLPTEVPSDPIEVRRLKAVISDIRHSLKKAETRAFELEDFRSELYALPQPIFTDFSGYSKSGKAGRRTVILHVSDIQYGEYIDYNAMDGINSYDIEIADARIRRFFEKSHRFMTELWQGEPVEKIILLLNGDMVSGALHHELDRTDKVRPIEASAKVATQLTNGINLLSTMGIPIEIISTVGNHGRLTIKPESKGHVVHNYDDLVAMLIEANFKDVPLVKIMRSKSVDAKFSVYGFPMLVTHGDRIGSRGGQGFMGATATILRGQSKVFMDYAQRGEHLYKIFTGHFHTPCETVWGYGNNCMAGVSEYARDGRMTPTPAAQGYFVVHETGGIIETRQIYVGTIEEGSSHSPAHKFH